MYLRNLIKLEQYCVLAGGSGDVGFIPACASNTVCKHRQTDCFFYLDCKIEQENIFWSFCFIMHSTVQLQTESGLVESGDI